MYLRMRGTCYCGNKGIDKLPAGTTVIAMGYGMDVCLALARPPYKVVLSQDVIRSEIQSGSTVNTFG